MTALPKSLVRRAREIIGDPKCWTQTATTRDELLQAVSPRSERAKKFCVFGALVKAAQEQGLSERWLVQLFDARVMSHLIRANDSQNHPDVLAFLEQLENEM